VLIVFNNIGNYYIVYLLPLIAERQAIDGLDESKGQ
jgi:hypothetical protein